MVEHLTLNQGVQGSNPWRSTASTIFEDTGALGMVLFFASNEPCYKWKRNILGSLLTLECSFFIYNTANAAEAKQLACELPAWLIAHNQAPPCLRASGMAHCPQACSIFPPGFRHGSLLTSMHHLSSSPPAVPQTLPAATAYRNNIPAHTFRPVL